MFAIVWNKRGFCRRARARALALAFAFGSTALAPSSRADVVPTGYTSLVVASTGKCLDISGGSSSAGASAVQWRCNFGANEQWTVQPFNGAYRVIEQQTGQCLSVAGASTAAGAQIVQNPCSGASAELWTFAPISGGFHLVSSNSGQCANVSANSTADAANVVQSPCSSAANFTWVFSSGLLTGSDFVDLQANHSGQCLNVSGASKSQGANVVQWPCSGAANEQWSLVQSGSSFQVVSKNSGLCLAVAGGSSSSGTNIVQSSCSTAGDRLWNLHPVGHAYQLTAQNSGLCLNVTGASQTSGAQAVQFPCGGGANELWSLSAAVLPSSWSGVISLAVNPIAIANLPNGRILMWSANNQFSFEGDIGSASGRTYTGIFDPASGSSSQVIVTNTGDDMFCPGTANLFDGRILVNGGSSSPKTSIYDPVAGTWSADARMNISRGYEGDAVLSNGSVFTLGGSWSGGRGGKSGEIWTSGSGWRLLSSVSADPVTGPDPQGVYRGDNHLWLFSAANGRVFHAGPSAQMHWITTAGNGSITSAGNRGDDAYAINGNAVLYDVGFIVKMGGAPAYQDTNATTSSYVISIVGTSATVTKVAPMAYRRAFSNAVALPNGQVVVIGGQTFPVPFSDDTSIFIPEIWDPDTRVFRQLKPMQTPRNYHSTAILLPDGRVFEAGGGQCGTGCAGNHLDAEILTPPYLLNSDGSAATRPSITSAPTTGALGGTLAVTTNTPVMSFVLMRLSSVTHTVSNDQRRVPLRIQSTSGASSYTLAIPSDPGTVLPGYYMLFALNARGVPSVAVILRIG
jgi:galactose oxidase